MTITVPHSRFYIFSHFDTKRNNRRDPRNSQSSRNFNSCQTDKIINEFNILNLCNSMMQEKQKKKQQKNNNVEKILHTYKNACKSFNINLFVENQHGIDGCNVFEFLRFFSCRNEELQQVFDPWHNSRSHFKKLACQQQPAVVGSTRFENLILLSVLSRSSIVLKKYENDTL